MGCACQWIIAKGDEPALMLCGIKEKTIFVSEAADGLQRLVQRGALDRETADRFMKYCFKVNQSPVWTSDPFEAILFADRESAREQANIFVFNYYFERGEKIRRLAVWIRPFGDACGLCCQSSRLIEYVPGRPPEKGELKLVRDAAASMAYWRAFWREKATWGTPASEGWPPLDESDGG